jgi:hypothetical protein
MGVSTISLGKVKFNWRGNWSAAVAFAKDDVVRYGANAYVCVTAHTSASTFAANLANWEVMVQGITFDGNYNPATLYQINDIVTYGGAIYVAIAESTGQTPSGNPSFWSKLVGGIEFENNFSLLTQYQTGDVVVYGGNTYIASQDTVSNTPTDDTYWSVLNKGYTYVGEYDNTLEYKPGEIVRYGGKIYACTTYTTPGTLPTDESFWFLFADGQKWEGTWSSGSTYKLGDIVQYGAFTYLCVQAASGVDQRPTRTAFWSVMSKGFDWKGNWSTSADYKPGDVVSYGARTYLCTNEIFADGSTINPPDVETYDWDLLTDGFSWQNVWSVASVDYTVGDVVRYGARSYVCILSHTSSGVTTPINETYWNIVNKGLDWKGAWSSSTVQYKLDDVVEYSGSSYVCITQHTSAVSPTPNVDATNWQALAVGDISSPMTTTGDMIYRASTGGIVRLPIGPSGSFLVVNNGIPSWGVQAPEQNYYVSLTGNNNNDGRTVATAWRTLEHACNETFNAGQAKISLLAGTYTELCPIKVGRSVVIEGDGLGSVTITPENSVDKGYGVGISKDGSTPNANSEVFQLNNGSRLRNIVFRGFGNGAVCVSLDPGYGPNDTSVWITSQSPYVQNCTSFTDLGTGMVIDGALHNGGYKSIVANDWTQINSDGIGFIVKNDGRSELVSCFTYYCNIGYLCEGGGKIRSVGGNNSYGEFGAVARGFSQSETPLTGNLQLSDDTINSVQTFSNNVHVFTSYKDFAGNLFCVGHTNPTGSDVSSTWSNSTSRPFIAKFTPQGNLDWSYTYTSAFGALHCIVEIDDQYYAGGVIYDAATNKGWLLKISASGEIAWQKTVGDTSEINDLTTDGSTFLYAVGNHNTQGATILRVQPSGIVSWSRTLDYNDSSINTLVGKSLCYAGSPTTSTDSYLNEGDATAEDDLYIACRDTTANVAMIIRMNNSGGLVTAYNYGDLHINKLRLDTGNGDGIYMMAVGYYDPAGAATRNPLAMRISILGDVEWQNQIADSTMNGEWRDVLPLGDDVYLSGYINDSDSTQTFNRGLIARYASNGVVTWTNTFIEDAENIVLNGVGLDGVNVVAAGFYQNNSVVLNIQRDLSSALGTTTTNNWALANPAFTISTSTVALKTVQTVYSISPTISLTDTALTLNQSPGIARSIDATRTGFAGIGTGVTFNVTGLSRSIKSGSVLQIQGNSNTYFVVSVANFDSGTGTASIGIDPALPSNLTPDDNTPVVFREAFSQVRMTGHDFLDIGSGGFADTNYPVIISSDYVQQPNSDREVAEENGGRVFYVTTDQDGNFRVGNYFKVEQATGRATLSSEEFDLSGLNELQLGSITAGRQGATVNEFSTDGTFADNSDTSVPTERATKTYVDNSILTAIGAASKLKVGTPPTETKVEVNGTGIITDTIDFSVAGVEVMQADYTALQFKPAGTLSFEVTSQYVRVPAGTNAERPVSPVNGHLRYNTDLQAFEGYVNSQWTGVGGGNPWTTKTANYTAVNNDRIFANTTSAAFAITLPASPSVGDSVRIIDVGGTFATNNLTVNRNSSNIMGLAENMILSTNYEAKGLVYSGATFGWVLSEV